MSIHVIKGIRSKPIFLINKQFIPKPVGIDVVEGTGLLQVTDGDNWTIE
jgi:hypothetical protein